MKILLYERFHRLSMVNRSLQSHQLHVNAVAHFISCFKLKNEVDRILGARLEHVAA